MAVACGAAGVTSRLQDGVKYPARASLESGDLLWPKKPNAIIPYDLKPDSGKETQEQRWTKERDAYVRRARASGEPDAVRSADAIAAMTFEEFNARYLRDLQPGQPVPYGLGGVVAVGHVAIVEKDANGEPYVIEALWTPGVVRSSYADWLKGRPGEVVWHGRLKGKSAEERARIAAEAKQFIGVPYDFWNFDLADTRGFYCSKLVWLAVKQAVGLPIDGDSNPRRRLWLSPKQVLNATAVERLLVPGNYGVD